MDFDLDLSDSYMGTKFGRIHYKRHGGSGASVIFIHGFGGSLRTWKRLVEFMPMETNIYLIDLLGHGESDAPGIEYSLDVHLDVLSEVIREAGPRPCLFGHSYGGWIAAAYAQKNGGLGGLVLEDSAGFDASIEDAGKRDPGYKDKLYEEAIRMNPREHVVRSSITSMRTDERLTRKSLGAIAIPALVVWGSRDEIISLKYGRAIAESVPGSTIKIIEGAGHVPHYTNPGEVSGILLNFLGHSIHVL
ncbi:MAG: alpha/beta hydrolase [Candidatus Marsarchaeota archaeon]|jgi:pimeloyl-ACP methyl ester carboxylesterase|nr:alpha/beta hydrolase [Candidatus Marsarchaeota archaeon]